MTNGADLHSKDNNGDTALIKAAYKGHRDVCALLLTNGAHVNATNNDISRTTALILAAKNDHRDVCELLVTSRADVNAKDGSGDTALIWAV